MRDNKGVQKKRTRIDRIEWDMCAGHREQWSEAKKRRASKEAKRKRRSRGSGGYRQEGGTREYLRGRQRLRVKLERHETRLEAMKVDDGKLKLSCR
jgi:hypothetical protein